MPDLLECPKCSGTLTAAGYCFDCKGYPLGRFQYQPSAGVEDSRTKSPRANKYAQAQPKAPEQRIAKAQVSSSKPEFDWDQLVRAQNRTTYAVRALGLWLFTSVNTLFISSNLSNLAQRTALNCKEYYSDCGASGWDTLSWVVISVGLSLGVYFGVKELNKSAIR
jgi:hypothetical protein